MKILNEKQIYIPISLIIDSSFDPEDYDWEAMEFTPAEAKAFRSSIKPVYLGSTDRELNEVVRIPSGFNFARIANVESDMFLLFSKDKNLLKRIENEY